MATYTTSGPVTLTVRFAAGDLRVEGVDRADVEIDVQPRSSSGADREYADATVVEQLGDEIRIIAPDPGGWMRRSGSLRVRASVPLGTAVTVAVESADVALAGALGGVDLTTSTGDTIIERAETLAVTANSADVVCRAVDGDATVKTASGDVRLGHLGGTGHFFAASGDVSVDAAGAAEFKAASGDVKIGRVDGSVNGKTASGDVRLGSVKSGAVEVDTASGDVTIGVAAGVSAWLELHSLSGDVSSALGDVSAPDDDDRTVAISVRTLSGDIRILRAS